MDNHIQRLARHRNKRRRIAFFAKYEMPFEKLSIISKMNPNRTEDERIELDGLLEFLMKEDT